MPDSVDSPAPDRTTTSPSATSSASVSRDSASERGGAVGAAVTGPWSLRIGQRAARSARGEFAVQPPEHLVVHAAQALRREGALEEAADAGRSGPGGAGAHHL